ncbi:MLP-like protein 43 [Cucurbita moschata]|uniref:MLP-like protein 43 n=1 Tax=Cucurbita moschata TaxID=3662 RepID=A0A6J1GV72_CUCMO|nr:MLP-like protein 43 [Cucurbita moschata]
MGCLEKLEAEVEINSPASKLHQTFHARPYHMCNASPNKLQSCKLLEGEWGKVGSVLLWNFVHDGKTCVSKELIEAIDEENNLVTFKVLEGDILKDHKSFKITMQGIPKGKEKSVVHWTLEYEKKHDKLIPNSYESSVMQLCVDVAKDLGAHLVKMESNQEALLSSVAA